MRRTVIGAVAVILTAACGSTVQLHGQVTAGGGLSSVDGGTSTPTATSRSTYQQGTDASGLPLPSHSTATQAGSASIGGTYPAGPAPTAGVVRTSGLGYSAKEIRIGFSTANDATTVLGGAGLGTSLANQNDLVNTWVTRVNASGGIAGRKVVPVFYNYSATGDLNTQDQAACATWTQDNHVYAATGIRAGSTGSGDNLTSCLARAGVVWLNGMGDAEKWSQYLDSMYSTQTMSRTREERVLVQSLAQQGFFAPGAKIGVIINNTIDNMSRAVDEGLVPSLAKLGLTITKRFVEANPGTESSNADLQMYTAGVTHVIFAAPGGGAASFFMQDANSQRHTYRYGISSQDVPALTVQSLAPASQAKNAIGYGYQPGGDVDANNQPAPTPGMKTCFGYYRSKGYSTGSLNQAAMGLICDSLNLLQVALRQQINPTRASLSSSVAGLGTSFTPASTFTSRFSATQHDGIGSYRALYFDSGCSCFRYRGPLVAIA